MKSTKINKERAIETAINYCKQNSLSISKLLDEYRSYTDDSYFFAHPNGVESDGLTNDLDSQMLYTLIVRLDYTVEETEYTRQYLSE